MSINIAINGFGRIGRHALRVALTKRRLNVVAINDLMDTKTLAHLLKHDTAYPDLEVEVGYDADSIRVGKKRIQVFSQTDPSQLPWKRLGIDVVVEATGRFTDSIGAGKHLQAGARAVVLSAPAKDGQVPTFVRGVNCHSYNDAQTIINNASCTTNSVAPIMQVLERVFGVEKAMLTTIHSYTADQNLQDGPHKDLRRARAAAQNIVPTSTGAALAVTEVIPTLQEKFDGLAIRVPTLTVSLSDITVVLKKHVTEQEVNQALITASKKELKGVLSTTDEELVSSDFIGNSASAVVDLGLTKVVAGNLVKVVAWYDNEWGYANRLMEMVEIVGT